jgi:HB1, ASXL, restriction endonuclease HTH domain/Restriction endonuclease
MTFLEAALEILKRERKPLHYKELTEKAMERKLLTFVGRTPEVTMQTQLTSAVKKAPGAPFVRVKPGIFGLLRYPEAAAPEPVVEVAPAVVAAGEKPGEKPGEGGEAARGRRRRRGGRGRRRDRHGDDEPRAESAPEAAKGTPADHQEADHPVGPGADEQDGAEEPNIGSLSAEARAAALAETGVLEGDIEEDELDANAGGDESAEGKPEPSDDDSAPDLAPVDADAAAETSDAAPAPMPEAETTPVPASATSGAQPSNGSSEGGGQGGRKVMSPVDAAIEILKGQSPGRGVHVRQIADSAVRRRLVHGEPNEAWRVMRAALASESKERLRAGLRPRIKSAGSGLFALSRRSPDADLEKAEYVFGEARRALRERTLAALEQRLGELTAPSFEAVARVLLQREGFGPATFVKRVEGTIYVEALRGRGFRPSRCLIALRPGVTSAGRRALGELRAGIRARNQDEGLLLLAGRLADDGISEWKQPGQPIEVVDGPAMAETCVRHGIGVISAAVAVDLIDADFFAELSEG